MQQQCQKTEKKSLKCINTIVKKGLEKITLSNGFQICFSTVIKEKVKS